MIIVRKINGKKVVFETNARGDIVSKDGKPVHHDKTFEEVRGIHLEKQHKYANSGFMQRNTKKY